MEIDDAAGREGLTTTDGGGASKAERSTQQWPASPLTSRSPVDICDRTQQDATSRHALKRNEQKREFLLGRCRLGSRHPDTDQAAQ